MKKNVTKSRQKSLPLAASFSNHEIVTLAVFLLGGSSSHVDTEDIAMKSNDIAPGRFTWKKYKSQVNLELIRVYLSDAKKPEKGEYLMGSGTDGWLLTEAGMRFARVAARKLSTLNLSRPVMGTKEKKWRRGERSRLLANTAFQKFISEGFQAVSVQEAATFFRIDEYVVGKLKEEKLTRVLNAFGDDPVIGQAVRELARKVRSAPDGNSN